MSAAAAIAPARTSVLGHTFARVGRLLGCILAALNPLTAVVLLGYLMRCMRFAATRELARAGERGSIALERPTLILGGARRLGGLRENVAWGLRGAVATFAMTLPATALMAVGWYAGWLNSFAKGYEQAPLGPLTSFAGIALFVPLAAVIPFFQARHAVTGDWRVYLDWRGSRTLLLASGYALPIVALAHLAALSVFTIANAGLTFAPQIPAFSWLTENAAAAALFERRWMFAWSVPFVALLFWAKRRAAIGYARALTCTPSGSLHPTERNLYDAFGVRATATGRGRRIASVLALLTALALSSGWIVLTYVGQFLNYRGAWGWLNPAPLMLPYLG